MLNLISLKAIKKQIKNVTAVECFPSIIKGTFRFILNVIVIVELSSMADIATWLVRVASGSVDITTYLVDSLWSGICVVLPTVPYPSSWLIRKTSLEVSIKTDFISFRKLLSSNSFGSIICWLDCIISVLSIWSLSNLQYFSWIRL